jgi:lipopolysaccharide/colanic/teichoic acid biosynthesis glycosyltransferase
LNFKIQSRLSALISRANEATSVQNDYQEPALALVQPLVPEASLAPLTEKEFRGVLSRERKRSERSRKPFLLMLVRRNAPRLKNGSGQLAPRVSEVLARTIRETDTLGWFKSDATIGVIFNELGPAVEASAATRTIETKISAALERAFGKDARETFDIDFYVFPEERHIDGYKLPIAPELYPDVFEVDEQKKTSMLIKRIMDVIGSALALILLSPVFLVLAVIIKLTSRGPVLFRQERVGQFEVPFTFLKFRSMRAATDPEIHREYVKNFIAGRAEPHVSGRNQRRVYKITRDPRVTWIGRFMRRTSLDELPQFWNVLMGQMSLVGPRPPIRYELDVYDVWHRRRLLEVKPGITGLWQIHGRSRTTFNDMVRLDLRYAKIWSPRVDIKILLHTPRAVLSGSGAY